MEQDIKNLLKLLAFLIVAIGIAGAVSYAIFGGFHVEDMRSYVAQYGKLSPLIFVAVTIAFVIFPPAPNDLMAIAAGLLFGFWKGLGLTILAFGVGSMIAWGLGRKFGRPFLKKISINHVESYTQVFQKYGALSVLVARMIPIISFDLVSYVAGILKLHPLKFAAATFLGMLPTVILLVKIGDILFRGWAGILLYGGLMLGVSITGILIFRKFKNSDELLARLKAWI